MGKITLHNYEAFILDFIEGRLSVEGEDELRKFAAEHLELNLDLNLLIENFPQLESEEFSLGNLNHLKKYISSEQEDQVLAYLENQMSEIESELFQLQLQDNPFLLTLLRAFEQTKLQGLPVFFEGKEGLKQTALAYETSQSAVLFVENQLQVNERKDFEKELASSTVLQNEVRLLRLSVLTPDFSISYLNKESLYKKSRVISIFNINAFYFAAAATVLIAAFWFLGSLVNVSSKQPTLGLVGKTTPFQPKVSALPHAGVEEKAPAKPTQLKKNFQELRKANVESSVVSSTGVTIQATLNELIQPQDAPLVLENNSSTGLQKTSSTLNIRPELPEEMPTHFASVDQLQIDEEFSDIVNDKMRHGFWRKAVSLASRINHLGLTAVKGEEEANNRFKLSFKSFSVEKK